MIPLEIGTKYLLRATFIYENYDALNSPPNFILLLDADVWDTGIRGDLEGINFHGEIQHHQRLPWP